MDGTGSALSINLRNLFNLGDKKMVPKEEKITLKDILPEITVNGIDYSLLTQREIQHLQLYSKLRNELSEKYPNPHPEYDDDTVNIQGAKKDEKASQFTRSIMTVHALLEKIDHLKTLAAPYEIHCVRLYCKLLMNWMWETKTQEEKQRKKQFLSIFRKSDIYEIVEAYFRICRKYGEPIYEEPYYWLSPKQRREIKYEGEMLKRSTYFDDSEIQVSLLEELV